MPGGGRPGGSMPMWMPGGGGPPGIIDMAWSMPIPGGMGGMGIGGMGGIPGTCRGESEDRECEVKSCRSCE